MVANNDTIRVQLWIGNSHTVRHKLVSHLRSWWCTSACEGNCAICHALQEDRWFFMRTIMPEKGVYTRDAVEGILRETQFSVDDGQRRVMVFESADLLGLTVANRLLKLLEEPPAGWFFFLTTERPDMVLHTVRSRCIEHRVTASVQSTSVHPVVACFNEPTLSHFIQAWEQHPISTAETVEILDAILNLWYQKSRKATDEASIAQCAHVIHIVTNAYDNLPMPGGHTIFWRLLFMNIMNIYKNNTSYTAKNK